MGSLGPTEIILIILVIVLLFGAKKLPDLARGSGRALRIFKAETKGLIDDDDDDKKDTRSDAHGRPLPPGASAAQPTPPPARPEPSREPVQDTTPRDQV
jgi:sec-independent protein translocase protein TatA